MVATEYPPTRADRPDPRADLYAWTAVHLTDGRVVSLAWLRGYAGAVASRWRRRR